MSQTFKNTLKMNSSGKKPFMNTTKLGGKIIKGILKEKFICGIC